MSFIDFESGTEKERIRQELRAAREELLKKAEKNSIIRDERRAQQKLTGNDRWMLPSVSSKIDKLSTEYESSKKSKKRSKSKKESKKGKKEKKKHRKHSSDDSEDSSSAEERIVKKNRKRRDDTSSESSDSNESDGADEWVEKTSNTASTATVPLAREDWMSGLQMSTFSKKDLAKDKPQKVDEKKHIDSYDPSKSGRELNPYWKDGGSGLPSAFQKPKADSDDDEERTHRRHHSGARSSFSQSGNWRKKTSAETSDRISPRRTAERIKIADENEKSPRDERSDEEMKEPKANVRDFLTDQQMNELGAKLIKAEIMGNNTLVVELKSKLDRARECREKYKADLITERDSRRRQTNSNRAERKNVESVLLTVTDERSGISRPLQQKRESDLWGGKKGSRTNKKRVETHVDNERVRFFADDDRHDLNSMFAKEKLVTADDQEAEFVATVAKQQNAQDSLDDIFADEMSRKGRGNDEKQANRERSQAIHQHEQMTKALETCERCFDSAKMEKQLIVAMGTKVYLSLPAHEPLQPGHCLIVPMQHVSCSTQLDEDVWEEISDFRKALTKMFAARSQEVIFFETAHYLHKRPHMVLHCVPSKDYELAPFYFKKAIQESEREWSTNKQLVDLRKEKKDVRRAIPKGLPYFWVHFNMDSGFAHVIEEQERFPVNFAQEIIGGMLNLDCRLWRKPRRDHHPIAKVKQFADMWSSFDITNP